MLNFFVKRPVTTIMFTLFWVVLGLVSYPKMNVERTPSIDFPMVTATFVYPGAAPGEIESQIIERAENAMSEVAGLKNVNSQIFENGGFVMAEFNLGVNVDDKASEVKAKLDALSNDFPTDMKTPVVEKLNPLQQPVMDIVLRGGDARDMAEYADDILSNKITAIPGVASMSLFGGARRAIRIQMNPDLMAARGAAIMDVVAALGNKNLNVPGGRIETERNTNQVRFIGEFTSVDDIKNLRITTPEGENFALAEIATITDAAADIENGARYNGENVVIASVVKASDGNAVKISAALRDALPEFQSAMQSKFPNAEMIIATDSSVAIADETTGTIEGIILGVVLTVLVLLAFTRNWRSTIVAGAVIPASLIAGFFFMDASGFTINSMTLLAYSTALGTLVANAIILIESALREMAAGKKPRDAAIDGTKKVAVPILAGVGTNVVVFLPLAFMGGIAGQFMMQFGMTVVYITILSLVISFTLTPMMIGAFLRLNKKEKPKTAPISGRYRKLFDLQFAHPGRMILAGVIALIASAQLLQFVGNEFSPSTDVNEINITARAPMGSSYQKSESIAQQIEKKLREFPQVTAITTKIGERGLQNIAIKVGLIDASERGESDKMLAQKMLPELSLVPDAEIQIKAGEGAGSAGQSSDLVLNISGDDDATRENYARAALDAINKIPEVQSAVLAQQSPATEIQFLPNQDDMNFWGVKNSYAGATLRTALYGNDDYKYKEAGREYPIILEFAKPFKNIGIFDIVYVNSQKGLVPLSELGTVRTAVATPDIRRLNKSRITEININIGKSTMGPVQKKIEGALAKINWGTGYGAQFGGMSEIQSETNTEIAAAFILAVALTFMLLAAILNSWVHPFTIATSIVTSFAGVFIMMFLTGASINIAAMLAFVMLVGLVVNNNILVLEPAIGRVARGEKPYDALLAEIGANKSMVLMTSIAVIAGMVPQLWSADGMKVSMGAVMVGGMLASLIFTFVLTPAIFFGMEKIRNAKIRKIKKS